MYRSLVRWLQYTFLCLSGKLSWNLSLQIKFKVLTNYTDNIIFNEGLTYLALLIDDLL